MNTKMICISRAEMRDNSAFKLKRTIHYSNRSGVCAGSPDCHIPYSWNNKIARKTQASKGVWGKIFGTAYTREKLLAKRQESDHDLPLVFTRMQGLLDPLRPGVPEAVAACRAGGIKVYMITGDYLVTVVMIGWKAGRHSHSILSG